MVPLSSTEGWGGSRPVVDPSCQVTWVLACETLASAAAFAWGLATPAFGQVGPVFAQALAFG